MQCSAPKDLRTFLKILDDRRPGEGVARRYPGPKRFDLAECDAAAFLAQASRSRRQADRLLFSAASRHSAENFGQATLFFRAGHAAQAQAAGAWISTAKLSFRIWH